MNKNWQLDVSLAESLGRFEGIVRTLLDSSSVDEAFAAAQDANIASIGLAEMVYKRSSNGGVSSRDARTYARLIGSCIGKFQAMINNPEVNGERWHYDLMREHMMGRLDLVDPRTRY